MNIKTFVSDPEKNYLRNDLTHFKNLGLQFNSAIFSWYDIARQYMPIVRTLFPETKAIVDSVDVHWLRDKRCLENKEITENSVSISDLMNIEKEIYSNADIVFAVTENDRQEILKEIGNNNIKILSNIHIPYENTSLGNDILFIGNFGHIPNIRAAENCIDIYSLYSKTKEYSKLKNKPKLYLVGANPSPKLFKKANNNKNIIFTGNISDLEDVYKLSKVMMAPLDSGAGIKGKICDASMRSLPILTTDIGNEGINLENNLSGFIENDQNGFVDALKKIYSMDIKKLKEIAGHGKQQIHNIVSEHAAVSCLKNTLEPKHIVISIVTFNNPQLLENCLSSILTNTLYPNYTIVITDNSNNMHTYKLLDQRFKKYKHILYTKNKNNDYFILPNNKVMNKYQESDIVLINDDIEIISSCWLSFLNSSAYSSTYVGAVGGKTIFPDGKLAEAGAELYNTGYGRNKGRLDDPNNIEYNKINYTGYCSGCLLYMKRETIDKIGVFDEDLCPMYYEDSEWQYRAHTFGYKTIYDPRCVAIHREGSSSGTDITKGMKRYQEINRLKFIEKYKNTNIEKYN
jgi:GT2 family glycosyltransferase